MIIWVDCGIETGNVYLYYYSEVALHYESALKGTASEWEFLM